VRPSRNASESVESDGRIGRLGGTQRWSQNSTGLFGILVYRRFSRNHSMGEGSPTFSAGAPADRPDRHLHEAAVMLAYAMHLFRTEPVREARTHPDGQHAEQIDSRAGYHPSAANRTSLLSLSSDAAASVITRSVSGPSVARQAGSSTGKRS
jgi:hypothetical protein